MVMTYARQQSVSKIMIHILPLVFFRSQSPCMKLAAYSIISCTHLVRGLAGVDTARGNKFLLLMLMSEY
jgi:hypothetical protein